MNFIEDKLVSRLETQTQHDREECTCPACGLIYQQRTSGYTDKVMHACCPRCGHYRPADQAQANEAAIDVKMGR